MSQVPITRICVAITFSGVPVGAQMAWVVWRSTGAPPAKTRIAPTTHCAVTHGPLPAGGTNGQPTIAYGVGCVTMGCPPTMTRGLGMVGCACPPCMHITAAPTCSRKPGTASSPKQWHSSSIVKEIRQEYRRMMMQSIECLQVTVSAPLLMLTAGPIITIEAPLPFWM